MEGSEDMILTPSDTIGISKRAQNFLRTVMVGFKDMILTPSDTTGTYKQFGGTEDLLIKPL